MVNYVSTVDKKIKDYFAILEPHFPEWLNEYINTKEMLHQQYISVSCGTIYTKLFNNKLFYSSLDHSIGVALITWHFTHDKTKTLASLFHDIATPCFKHSIDFLNGDYDTQESTEDLTHHIISNSKEIMTLLKKDNIKIEEVDNYHIYPICDNDTPRLSSDRLEYTLSNALLAYSNITKVTLNNIKDIYTNIEIQTNEDGIAELGFKDKKYARLLVKISSKLSIIYRSDETRYSMQFLADIISLLNKDSLLKNKDLYILGDKDIINIIENSKYKDVFNIWKNATKINISKSIPKDVYYVYCSSKVRYIDPLVKGIRISKICKIAKKYIDNNLSYKMDNYIYLDFKLY